MSDVWSNPCIAHFLGVYGDGSAILLGWEIEKRNSVTGVTLFCETLKLKIQDCFFRIGERNV